MPSKSRHDPLEEAYREETARLVRARFPYAVGYYLVASAALLFLEWQHHPERAMWLTWRDLLGAHVPAFVTAGLTTAVIAGTATILRSWLAPPPVIVVSAVVLAGAALVLLVRWLPPERSHEAPPPISPGSLPPFTKSKPGSKNT